MIQTFLAVFLSITLILSGCGQPGGSLNSNFDQNLSPQAADITINDSGEPVVKYRSSLEDQLNNLKDQSIADSIREDIERRKKTEFDSRPEEDRIDFGVEPDVTFTPNGDIKVVSIDVIYYENGIKKTEQVHFKTPSSGIEDDFMFEIIPPGFAKKEITMQGECLDLGTCRTINIWPAYYTDKKNVVKYTIVRPSKETLEVIIELDEDTKNKGYEITVIEEEEVSKPHDEGVTITIDNTDDNNIEAKPVPRSVKNTGGSNPEKELSLDNLSLDVDGLSASPTIDNAPNLINKSGDAAQDSRPVLPSQLQEATNTPDKPTLKVLKNDQMTHAEDVKAQTVKPDGTKSRRDSRRRRQSKQQTIDVGNTNLDVVELGSPPSPSELSIDVPKTTEATVSRSDQPSPLSKQQIVDAYPLDDLLDSAKQSPDVMTSPRPTERPLRPSNESSEPDSHDHNDEHDEVDTVSDGVYLIPNLSDEDDECMDIFALNSGQTYSPCPTEIKVEDSLLDKVVNGVYNQSIGKHTFGSLENATHLKSFIPGVTLNSLRSVRKFQWGSGVTTNFIEFLARSYKNMYSDSPICVNRISAKGGEEIPKSASHQNGLDVDIAYPSNPNQCGTNIQFVHWAELKAGDQRFFEKNWALLRFMLIDTDLQKVVSIIFTDKNFMEDICVWAKQNNHDQDLIERILKKLYHIGGHDNHYHIRLMCIHSQNKKCEALTGYKNTNRKINPQTCKMGYSG